jgi:hypothetical protein
VDHVVDLGYCRLVAADPIVVEEVDLASVVRDLGARGSREVDLQEPCLWKVEAPCYQSLACPL